MNAPPSNTGTWVIDGNNVMGAGADGWWNDPPAAAARTAQAIARWSREHGDVVTVVFDGRPEPRVARAGGGNLTIDFARRPGRDAADDRIVEIVEELLAAGAEVTGEGTTVVTSDRGLRARLPGGVAVEGAGAFRQRIGLASGRRRG